MSIKVTCTKVHLNETNPLPEYYGYIRSSHDPALLVSPLVVAGIVIGLVLFLSCVTIIIGSLKKKKDGGGRDWRLENPSYDGISYATSSFGDLSYEDCVRPGTLELYLPTDDPPPYSLEDPHFTQTSSLGTCTEEMPLSSQITTGNLQVASSLSSVNLQVPTMQSMAKRILHLPVIPKDILKDDSPPAIAVSEDNLT